MKTANKSDAANAFATLADHLSRHTVAAQRPVAALEQPDREIKKREPLNAIERLYRILGLIDCMQIATNPLTRSFTEQDATKKLSAVRHAADAVAQLAAQCIDEMELEEIRAPELASSHCGCADASTNFEHGIGRTAPPPVKPHDQPPFQKHGRSERAFTASIARPEFIDVLVAEFRAARIAELQLRDTDEIAAETAALRTDAIAAALAADQATCLDHFMAKAEAVERCCINHPIDETSFGDGTDSRIAASIVRDLLALR